MVREQSMATGNLEAQRAAHAEGQGGYPRSRPVVAGAVFCLSSAALVWQFALYPIALKLLTFLRPGTAVRRRQVTPTLTVIIPAHNEEVVIERRVMNIRDCEYPEGKLEIMVVDDGSADGTAEIVERLAREASGAPLRLLRQATRQGKPAAINAGIAQASGEIIVVSDAPALFDRLSLKRIVSNLADDTVGAASGTLRPIDRGTQAHRLEGLFWRFKNVLTQLEGEADSTSYMQGKLCSFRRDILERIDEDTCADDVNVALHVRARGYRVVVDREAFCYQQKPTKLDELTITKTRAAVGGIQESFRFRHMLFRPRYGLFGMMIFPTRVLYSPLGPFLVTALALSATNLALARLRPWSWGRVITAMLASISLTWPLRRFLLPPALTFLFSQWVILRAFVAWILGQYDVKWQQAKSTRESTPVEPPR